MWVDVYCYRGVVALPDLCSDQQNCKQKILKICFIFSPPDALGIITCPFIRIRK